MALDGMTPAEKAGIDLNLGHNKLLGLIKLAVGAQHLMATSKVT